MIKKLLVANRGEIALRVIRAARELGIKSVAIYSEIDRWMDFVFQADEAYCIGPAPSRESYLKADRIVELAKRTGAQAIHPGYGFLAEDPSFARLCEQEGIIFVGPSSKALAKAGNKINSRQIAERLGVPTIPAVTRNIKNEKELTTLAKRLGFPIITKAAGGGGGKGMRIIRSEDELLRMYREAKSEAKSSFADSTIYLEKYLSNPRHVEIQILADKHGEIVHLGERECSIQRRHQKLIEETPSVIMDEDLRSRMGEAAKKIARLCGYTNAGTVEFLLDQQRNFYFLEINARLQVEHPVTELAVGVDLVKEQLKIASGQRLPFKQEQIKILNHAIECRICAEDPFSGFTPSIGKILELRLPTGPAIRLDIGVLKGSEITMYYDSLIAKLISWGKTRESAITSMLRALREFKIVGLKTTIPLHLAILESQDFRDGRFGTNFLESFKPPEKEIEKGLLEALLAAGCLEYLRRNSSHQEKHLPISCWRRIFTEGTL
jgi:acetyl-CoA carboxylase biotin carboxylase subunit